MASQDLIPTENVTNGAHRDSTSTQASEQSQTAQDFIASQLQLEADAREALPYSFDSCTKPLGPLRQDLFSCLTCNPPPSDPAQPYTAAGVCYACSISCHGEHELVELFSRRNFVCDCGTSRLPSTSPCSLRLNAQTERKGDVHSEEPARDNTYNQNFANRFCGCGEVYDAEKEKGVMFQCVGLGNVKEGGCGEDWWHAGCIMGLSRDWAEERPKVTSKNDVGNAAEANDDTAKEQVDVGSTKSAAQDATQANETNQPQVPEGNGIHTTMTDESSLPPGFPNEDDFDHFICYKCVGAFPWIKRYAGSSCFLHAVPHDPSKANKEEPAGPDSATNGPITKKRKLEKEDADIINGAVTNRAAADEPSAKRTKSESEANQLPPPPKNTNGTEKPCLYDALPAATETPVSLFLQEDFRSHFCHCPKCFPQLARHPQLLEEEDIYAPPLSRSTSPDQHSSAHSTTRSLLDRGEAALSNMDRVRAIEGVMAYNHMRDKVKDFLKPFAESGTAVGAEDVKKYFAKLRGDEEAMRMAASGGAGGAGGNGSDNRKKQSGY